MVSTIAEEGPDRIHCLTTAVVRAIDLSHTKSPPPLPRMAAPPREKGGATSDDSVTERDDFDG
jgi:hypothetical protein